MTDENTTSRTNQYTFIIPVYNRPEEIKELLQSLTRLKFSDPFEVVVVEDGSTQTAEKVIASFSKHLNISYFKKNNTGPGHSRNYGMQRAKGNYFIILDSDCILPSNYLQETNIALNKNYAHCFGGPDRATSKFTDIQKAINYAMTSFLSTGGIRGKKKSVQKFQPRSFNMGLSKEAFLETGGFGSIHPGEDPDLSIRLWKKGYTTRFISGAWVYHKRRINWNKFRQQIRKFGLARGVLNQWHPKYAHWVFWFPSLFALGAAVAILGVLLGFFAPIMAYSVYFITVWTHSTVLNKSPKVGFLSVWAVAIMLITYGMAFIKSVFLLKIKKREPKKAFPSLFFAP